MVCEKHGEYPTQTIRILGKEITLACPECIKEREEKERTEHQLFLKDKANEKLRKQGIEPEYFDKTLDDYVPENASEKKALDSCIAMVQGKIKKLLLLGNNGCGKTHLANALVRSLDGVRTTMYELSAQIRQGYQNGTCELDILNKLLEYPLIVIDEVGRTKGSEAEFNWLSYLVDKAHTRGIRLVMVSNKLQAQSLPADKKMNAIEFFLPNDVISRLRQDSIIVEINGRDRRANRTTPAAI